MRVTFDIVNIGEEFELNGTRYIKKSNRTAQMLAYHRATFYVDQKAVCKRLAIN